MAGSALEQAASIEVVAAYSAPQTRVQGVAATPGWYVVGGFYLPTTVTAARTDVLGLLSKAALTMRVRLFDLTTNAEVSGSAVSITAQTPTRALSGAVELTGNRNYQIQAECTGDALGNAFGILHAATITD